MMPSPLATKITHTLSRGDAGKLRELKGHYIVFDFPGQASPPPRLAPASLRSNEGWSRSPRPGPCRRRAVVPCSSRFATDTACWCSRSAPSCGGTCCGWVSARCLCLTVPAVLRWNSTRRTPVSSPSSSASRNSTTACAHRRPPARRHRLIFRNCPFGRASSQPVPSFRAVSACWHSSARYTSWTRTTAPMPPSATSPRRLQLPSLASHMTLSRSQRKGRALAPNVACHSGSWRGHTYLPPSRDLRVTEQTPQQSNPNSRH